MNLFEKAAQLSAEHTPFAVATIVSSSGSTPRSKAKMIVLSNGKSFGTIGGGPVEGIVIEEALQCIRFDRSTLLEYALDKGDKGDKGDKVESITMECGGSLKVFIECVNPGPRLVLVGGGHVSLEIAKVAAELGFRVEVVEERAEFCSAERFPMAAKLYLENNLEEAMASLPSDPSSFIIIATNSSDERALRYFVGKSFIYLGMLGSRRKVRLLMDKLADEGVPQAQLAGIRAPIGLDIGAETPQEIAISIAAELLAVRSGHTGVPLSGDHPKRVVVRGGGDIATGTICRLFRSGFEVVVLEIKHPTVIRRSVAFAQAMFDGTMVVEGIIACRVESFEEIEAVLTEGKIPVIADPEGSLIPALRPAAVVDAILAKKNLGTHKKMAPAVIGLGPGFSAGDDVDAVIETNRGHHLGSVILHGQAQANTNVPGNISGVSAKRVIRAPVAGIIEELCALGDIVRSGDPVMAIRGKDGQKDIVTAPIDGMVRGLIKGGSEVTKEFKIGDVDPRGEKADFTTVSDKARAVAGGVLEAILMLLARRKKIV
ncbi:selenium-dependent molybdenum cofactor biosynthesis protein YqeB [Sediminispirochaeta smaragdinae]|uniref:Selenium-dependent molybdenum hydroxylase system protein, YqeB family n=1 Tax=Sediminispirochaeta smaragdinae (strain DSM 11293 / JCM 15392 / SEBR 4228) TaxID=573413 RepID=E1R3S0_SEDSS|nr:selenium-dependent molybdenum cofactor biosynthesis protein YqeB [Sediminispirochaeta smaragdinae]ADK82041.1 selenium-dependent molybdenum hydroxylase system protein, YqeB family [Sediminispirochaeta smaragdinae DSM 11293]